MRLSSIAIAAISNRCRAPAPQRNIANYRRVKRKADMSQFRRTAAAIRRLLTSKQVAVKTQPARIRRADTSQSQQVSCKLHDPVVFERPCDYFNSVRA